MRPGTTTLVAVTGPSRASCTVVQPVSSSCEKESNGDRAKGLGLTRMRSRAVSFLIVTVRAAAVDQAVKAAMVQLLADAGPIGVSPFPNLRLGYNTGVSFSMFAETCRETPWLLAAIMMGIVLLVAVFAIRAERRLETFSFGLIAGGAVGNIIDRLRLGAVVDYLDLFYAGWRWPTFNLADTLIFLGVALSWARCSSASGSRRQRSHSCSRCRWRSEAGASGERGTRSRHSSTSLRRPCALSGPTARRPKCRSPTSGPVTASSCPAASGELDKIIEKILSQPREQLARQESPADYFGGYQQRGHERHGAMASTVTGANRYTICSIDVRLSMRARASLTVGGDRRHGLPWLGPVAESEQAARHSA